MGGWIGELEKIFAKISIVPEIVEEIFPTNDLCLVMPDMTLTKVEVGKLKNVLASTFLSLPTSTLVNVISGITKHRSFVGNISSTISGTILILAKIFSSSPIQPPTDLAVTIVNDCKERF